MLSILSEVPFFVWPLFILLLLGGIKASKPSLVPLKTLLFIPTVFFGWAIFSFFGKYSDFSSILLWIAALGIGIFVGFTQISRLKLRFDDQKKTVEMPGSWIPLALSMSIFSTKFSLGMMRGMLPHLENSLLFLTLELFSSFILGVFIGRGAACFVKAKISAPDQDSQD